MEPSSTSSKMSLVAVFLLMAIAVNFDLSDAQSRTCYYSYYHRRYICYDYTYYQRQQTVQSCSNSQRSYYYAQSSFDACCGPQAVVTSGTCCKAKYYTHYYNCRTYCMCSTGATCRTNVIVPPVVTPTKPTTTTTTPTTTTTTPTTTTTTPTTTTTTPTTTTTTTTTKKPTTTTTKPTTTTTTPTTTTPTTTTTTPTTTTTKTTTAAPVKKLCPSYRLLNSVAANECDYPGITSISRKDGTGATISSCNAVLVPAQIGGATKAAFFTTKLCKDQLLNLAIKGGQQFDFKIGGRSYPIDIGSMFDIVDDPSKGSSFFMVKDRFATLFDFQGSCQHPACIITKSMVGDIDYSDCDVVSYGVSQASDLSEQGLRKVKVHVTINDLCSPQKEFFGEVNTMCFTTSSGKNLFCSNDMAAPVFCKSRTSNEKILIGGAAFQAACDTSPSFRLVPYPVTKLTPVPVTP